MVPLQLKYGQRRGNKVVFVEVGDVLALLLVQVVDHALDRLRFLSDYRGLQAVRWGRLFLP